MTRAPVRRILGLAVACLILGAPRTLAQNELEKAVERARAAWLDHDVEALVANSDTVRLRLPGVRSASLRPGQAARLLDRYLKPSQERTFALVEVRQLAEDHAYAEVARRYVVRGTDEEREETVFLGFRFLDGRWRLREVNVTP
ncbi:MAG: hypothetical protein GTN62_15635 [Gemmatimonadales bacterium]|nr:hypothetical protein [Gemmatimonadales bacterium]NIN13525.1 hypothetical protein [Gemmatimonadales bacterium]NIN51519.1 hypothetical protein [Gemmatimonadales bacterium]NIP08983.1 hypothetical protein [Gemmatimonadales bacterium]NIR03761.1 hypothetical protein [Gemmatimonadales bacterium]